MGEEESPTLRHVTEIARFLQLHASLWGAHIVDFFQENLWEKVDGEWLACLRPLAVENWLLLPSGVVRDEWPKSLKEFVLTAQSLALHRKPAPSQTHLSFPEGSPASIGSVLAQGMSVKKCHEIGILGALIAHVAKMVAATDVIDVGAGQGYLALVLAFQYQLTVVAVDACAHHANVTNERAERIRKYYNARLRKSQQVGSNHPYIPVPRTVTCRVVSGEAPTALASLLPHFESRKNLDASFGKDAQSRHTVLLEESRGTGKGLTCPCQGEEVVREEKAACAVVLAGLHACGDLSSTMLRTFLECKEVKAVINVGCCYNLLSEDSNGVAASTADEPKGFPLSQGVRRLGLQLGKNGCDLACQSAERWRDHVPETALQNFKDHAFRAAFQLVLLRFYPETALAGTSVGRSGKARRRRQARRAVLVANGIRPDGRPHMHSGELARNDCNGVYDMAETCRESLCLPEGQAKLSGNSSTADLPSVGKHSVTHTTAGFEEYARAALQRLDLPMVSKNVFVAIWEEVAPYLDYVGPFWTLRAVVAPVLESYILLDRLLYLEEQGKSNFGREGKCDGITAGLVPLFDPSISPRNVAIIAYRDLE